MDEVTRNELDQAVGEVVYEALRRNPEYRRACLEGAAYNGDWAKVFNKLGTFYRTPFPQWRDVYKSQFETLPWTIGEITEGRIDRAERWMRKPQEPTYKRNSMKLVLGFELTA